MQLLETDKLINLCTRIHSLPNVGVIYIQRGANWVPEVDANLYLSNDDEEDNAISEDPIVDEYFLEVDIAKEVIEVWNKWNGTVPNPFDTCEAVIHYAKFDAYKEPEVWKSDILH